jgi:hypothetical protein
MIVTGRWPAVELRGLEPLAFWLQTTGAALLMVTRSSSARVRTLAQDSCSAPGLLYLTAVWVDWQEQETVKGRLTLILRL